MKIAIHQPQYMAWLGYFHKMANVDLFILLDDVQFKKNEWQHRNRIRSSQGWQWLSVPNSYEYPQCINQVKVSSDKKWAEKHIKTLQMCYGKTPFFQNYRERFEDYYLKEWVTMDLLLEESVRLIARMFGIKTPIERSSLLQLKEMSTRRLIAICKEYDADTYIAGAGGQKYMEESLFKEAGIRIEYQEFVCPKYPQHWCKSPGDFIPDLSSVDLLFNCGPQSLNILMGKNEHAHSTF